MSVSKRLQRLDQFARVGLWKPSRRMWLTYAYVEGFVAVIGIVLCATGSFAWWTVWSSAFFAVMSATTFLRVRSDRTLRR